MLGRQLNEARRAAAGGGRTVSTTSSTMPSPFLQQAEATQTQWNEGAQQSVSVQTGGKSLPSSPIDPSEGEGSEEVESLRVQLRELNMQKAQLLQTVGQGKAGIARARLSAQKREARPASLLFEASSPGSTHPVPFSYILPRTVSCVKSWRLVQKAQMETKRVA
jgi:hypothetical protein